MKSKCFIACNRRVIAHRVRLTLVVFATFILVSMILFGSSACFRLEDSLPEIYAPGCCIITVTSEGHGSITPKDIIILPLGHNQEFTITPDNGYRVATLEIDGVRVKAANVVSLDNVTANHVIKATFDKSTTQTQSSTSTITVAGAATTSTPQPSTSSSSEPIPVKIVRDEWDEVNDWIKVVLGGAAGIILATAINAFRNRGKRNS